MDPQNLTIPAESSKGPKRSRPSEPDSSSIASNSKLALILSASKTNEVEAQPDESSLIPRTFERLALTVNPEFLATGKARGQYGFNRTFASRNQTFRYYTINLVNFKATIVDLLTKFLTLRMREKNEWSEANIATEVDYMVPLIRDACCTALYARLRPVHRSIQEYANRFTTASVYTKDLELPLPLADAIQNFGPFTPAGIPQNYYCVPVYPENTQHEGRTDAQWRSSNYEAIIPRLKDLGIPFKSIDSRIKSGTSWWTLYPRKVGTSRDLVCIFPPINYSEHSTSVACLFLFDSEDGENSLPIINFNQDEQFWPARARDLPIGYKLRAFAALCQAPRTEWNEYLLIK